MDLLMIIAAIVVGVFAWTYFFGDGHSNDADGADDNHRHDDDSGSDSDGGGDGGDGGDGGGD